MPVLKTYKNGVWEPVSGMSEHTHTKDDITDFPSSLPANGGNADTLDGKHANEFALTTDVDALKSKIGDTSVSEQINTALENHKVSWNDLTEKPFGDGEAIEITWDGDYSSVETKVFEVEDKINEDCYSINGYFLVSDMVPSHEDLLQGRANCFYSDYYSDGGEYSFSIDSTMESYDYPCAFLADGHSIVFEPKRGDYSIIVARRENISLNGTILPKTGIYFALTKIKGQNYRDTDFYVTSLTLPSGTIYLDEKYIPDTIARVSDIPSTEGLATETYVDNAVAAMVDSAPEALNTLNELAAALGDDENFAATITNQIAGKANVEHEHSWNDLNEKPFGEEAFEIIWDGNLDSIEHYAVILEDMINNTGDRTYACLVSDKTPTDDELCRLQYTEVSYQVYGDTRVETGGSTNDFSEIPPEVLFNYGSIKNCGDITVVAEDFIYIVRKDNAEYNGVIFPKAGMYVYRHEFLGNIGSLSFVKEIKIPSIIKLDEKFIPDTIARVGDIPEGFSGSWNDLTDKPFDGGEVNTIEITWDGDTSGKLSFDEVPPFGLTVYRVSDLVVSKNDLEGAIFIHGQADDDLHEFVMSSNFVIEGNGYLYDEYGFIHVINDGSDESGIYFASDMGRAYGRVYSMSFTATTPVKTIDPKYLPDISEIVDTAVTAALTEAKESGEFDGAPGADGKDGVSCTHSWNGTTLSVTSVSGTSSANLKGEKGDKGDKGDTGATGANGTNGKDGADGKTPVKGTDYYTEADKTEMVSRVLSALPTWTGGNY